MGADYSFELIFIETYAPQFIGHNKIFLGSVMYYTTIEWKLKEISLEMLIHGHKNAPSKWIFT